MTGNGVQQFKENENQILHRKSHPNLSVLKNYSFFNGLLFIQNYKCTQARMCSKLKCKILWKTLL